MPRSDDSLDRLRAAIDELAAADAADLLTEARIEARARVRATLTDALAHSMLERVHEQLEVAAPADSPAVAPAAPAPAPAPAPARALDPTPRARAPKPATPATRASEPASPPPAASGAPAWYVYGVVGSSAELGGSLPAIDPGRPVTILREGAVAAVASQVPLEEFDETRMREHLADMAWVEATARAHEGVLELVREQATLIPMRMCTVYRTEGGVREMLSREAGPLQEALEHLDGKAEWGVKVFTDFARAGGRIRHVDTGAGESSGLAYMEERRTEREHQEQALELAEEAAAQVHERLSSVAADAGLIPLQRPEVSGHAGDMVLNGVYLVADEATPDLHEAVAELRSELEDHGIEVVLTGPWPAYNFVAGTIGAGW